MGDRSKNAQPSDDWRHDSRKGSTVQRTFGHRGIPCFRGMARKIQGEALLFLSTCVVKEPMWMKICVKTGRRRSSHVFLRSMRPRTYSIATKRRFSKLSPTKQ
ncbi:unnamed protein product [Ixodes persulcatus]